MKQRSRLELIGTQTLLVGVTFAAERALQDLNDARTELGLPMMHMVAGEHAAIPEAPRRGRPPSQPRLLMAARDNEEDNEPGLYEAVPAKASKRHSAAARKSIGSQTAMRWRIVKAANLYKRGSGSPSAALLERATKLLKARGQWPLSGMKDDTTKGAPRAPKKVLSKTAKKALVTHTKHRWATIKAAGLDSGGRLPSNELLSKALRILERRAKKAATALQPKETPQEHLPEATEA